VLSQRWEARVLSLIGLLSRGMGYEARSVQADLAWAAKLKDTVLSAACTSFVVKHRHHSNQD
jgi:hypothetical protein